MAYPRRSPQHRGSASPATRKYPLRRSPSLRRRRHASEDLINTTDVRQVLVPLHPNLRRLPSRLQLAQQTYPEKQESRMAHNAHTVKAGIKRKRVTNVKASNENLLHSTRSKTKSKRLKSNSLPITRHVEYSTSSEEEQEKVVETEASDEEGEPSEMDVDGTLAQGSSLEESDIDNNEEDEEVLSDEGVADDSTDDHLLNSAPPKQLFRLRKQDLVRLYELVGLSDDAEAMTKSDIIDGIITARADFASLPPSSPPGQGDFSSDGNSSDDGNVAGDEETDSGCINPLSDDAHEPRRRATMGGVKKSTRRSFSMGHLQNQSPIHRKANGRASLNRSSTTYKRKSSNRSSPTTSLNVLVSSPLVTRLRSRKLSNTHTSISTPMVTKNNKGKTKVKQVAVLDDDSTVDITSKNRGKEHEKECPKMLDEESDLTELEELEASLKRPSPRRLRSKDRELAEKAEESYARSFRKVSVRCGKNKVVSLKEVEVDDVELLNEDTGEASDIEAAEEEEVDELISSASATPVATPKPQKGRRTPLRSRLRPRKHVPPPSDGDDEGEEDEADETGEILEELDQGSAEERDESTIVVEPRKLRNGKIVGDGEEDLETEEDISVEEDIGDEDEADDDEEDEEETEEVMDDTDDTGDDEDKGIGVGVDGEVEEEDGAMDGDEDVDLTIATAKTLVRLRRGDLVRLCESRDLEPVGTKPQLAEALLQWRDRQASSSPSSCGTVRPSSHFIRRRRSGRKSSEESVPLLLRSEYTHLDEPMTPLPIGHQAEKERLEKETDQELELDLESLGLEDREIPPEKIQKLEKIGSGGFKDVFIGKFRGRKIAISEFRGQLSAMDIKELKLLGGFDHPNIVRFLGVSIPENTRETPVMIVSELCSNGDLFDYVRNVQAPTLHKILIMMLDIARGLEYLHLRKPSVIHRDCKSSNILITAKGTAKIADFGLAKVKQSTRSMVRSLVGTVNWQAPELWHAHPKYNHKVDVFSCAMVYWEILQWHLPNKKFPWEGMNEHAIYEIVGSKRQRPSVAGLRKQWCPEIVDLIERMWAQDHQDRPTMSEVVEALEDLVAHR